MFRPLISLPVAVPVRAVAVGRCRPAVSRWLFPSPLDMVLESAVELRTRCVPRSRPRGNSLRGPSPMAAPYEQRNPRDNLLYQLIETHFDTFE